jgi:hypothetical protein
MRCGDATYQGAPTTGGDDVSRVLTGYIHNDPNRGLSGIFAALSRVPREASMPRPPLFVVT